MKTTLGLVQATRPSKPFRMHLSRGVQPVSGSFHVKQGEGV